jgi:hypothetical protein
MSRSIASRLVAMIVAVGILAPFGGGRFFATIAAWLFGFYILGLFCMLVVRTVPSFAKAREYDWVRRLTVRDVTNQMLIDIAPWVFIACGTIVAIARVIGLARGVWIN